MKINLSLKEKQKLRNKYREEREKRLRPDGNEQYIELKDQLAYFWMTPIRTLLSVILSETMFSLPLSAEDLLDL